MDELGASYLTPQHLWLVAVYDIYQQFTSIDVPHHSNPRTPMLALAVCSHDFTATMSHFSVLQPSISNPGAIRRVISYRLVHRKKSIVNILTKTARSLKMAG
jgi:hypothetical protein